jgi:cyclic pyranopterin phosphate synthase
MTSAEKPNFSHIDPSGKARMVDVGGKPVTKREAVARGVCRMRPETGEAIRGNTALKGDVLAVARLAGIMAAKRTDELIPLCHTVPLDQLEIDFQWTDVGTLEVRATAVCHAKTGVEMEALVAVSAACLTVYDMCKSMDREMQIESIRVEQKRGGVSGDWCSG